MRHFLRFINLDDTFLKHGFKVKVCTSQFYDYLDEAFALIRFWQTGAAFKLNDKPVGCTSCLGVEYNTDGRLINMNSHRLYRSRWRGKPLMERGSL